MPEATVALKPICHAEVVEDGLALSLEWSTRLLATDEPRIVVSDSKGGVSVYAVNPEGETLSEVFEQRSAHEFECWIAAFDARNDCVFFSGGDDAVLKCHDTRDGFLQI
jgi:diphthamide biosynthesis protein 7